jgi:hypothetical protein
MKKLFIAITIITSVSFCSCDYVDVPQPSNTGSNTTTIAGTTVKKILIEDYTGHTCVFCPTATDVLEQIRELYGEKIVSIGIHAGPFAQPIGGNFTYDFRTPVGNEYDGSFGASAAGLPRGLINRRDYSTSHLKDYNEWASIVAGIISDVPDVSIKITNTYTSADDSLKVNIESKFLNAINGDYKLVVLMTEDSIIKPQRDTRQTPETVLNYIHRHVLRDAINSSWGDQIVTTQANANDIVASHYAYKLQSEWEEKHCAVVAFIYNSSTYEIIQTEEKKIQ